MQLGKNLKARGPVEAWLAVVEAQMHAALRAAAKRALREVLEVPRADWIMQHPAQLVLALSSVLWCSQVGRDLPCACMTLSEHGSRPMLCHGCLESGGCCTAEQQLT